MQKSIITLLLLIGIATYSYSGEMTQSEFKSTKAKCDIQNNADACSKLYYYYISSKRSYLKDLQSDKQKALYYAKKACDLNDSDGCFTAGMTLYYGDQHSGIARNKEKGRTLLRKACSLGKEDVCTYFLNPRF